MWKGLDYQYTKGVLRLIAACYGQAYITDKWGNVVNTNTEAVTEYMVDFDRALNAIGRCKDWFYVDCYESLEWKYCRKYGIFQKVIIADILGVTDKELEKDGLYSIPKLKGTAYAIMAQYLNGIKITVWQPGQSGNPKGRPKKITG